MRARWTLIPCLVCLACGHSEEAGPLKEPPPAPANGDSISVGPLSGRLLGEHFAAHSARYYVDQRPGYEKVDIKLFADKAPTSCGDFPEKKQASVWLRRKGATRVSPGTFRANVKDGGEWEVHYQVRREERWLGYGEANALFVITTVDPDLKIRGELSACFRDPSGSCVAGRFVATYCRIGIDAPVRGTEAMERQPKKPMLAPKGPNADAKDSGAEASTPPPGPSASAPPGQEPRR